MSFLVLALLPRPAQTWNQQPPRSTHTRLLTLDLLEIARGIKEGYKRDAEPVRWSFRASPPLLLPEELHLDPVLRRIRQDSSSRLRSYRPGPPQETLLALDLICQRRRKGTLKTASALHAALIRMPDEIWREDEREMVVDELEMAEEKFARPFVAALSDCDECHMEDGKYIP